MKEVKANIQLVRERIKAAAERANRSHEEIKLICVTKKQPVDLLQAAIEAGERVFGENRVQELVEKWPSFPQEIDWHLIGHLQANKVKYVVDKVSLIHSLDKISLAREISNRFSQKGKIANVLVQVNVSKEESKFGLDVNEVVDFVTEIKDYDNLVIKGLMTMAPFTEDAEEVRPFFRELRLLKDKVNKINIPGVQITQLSMGMTNDYEIAVEEGATLVRIGSGIFGERTY